MHNKMFWSSIMLIKIWPFVLEMAKKFFKLFQYKTDRLKENEEFVGWMFEDVSVLRSKPLF